MGDTAHPAGEPGPRLLQERTLLGIFVHLLGLPFGALATGVVYLVTDHEFTEQNARNATNWHLFVFSLWVAVFGLFGVAAVLDLVAPDIVLLPLLLVLVALVFAAALLVLATFVFILVATGKAIFGTAWEYPLAPDLVAWLGERFG